MAMSEKNIHNPYTEPIFYFKKNCTDSKVREIVNWLSIKHLPEKFKIAEAFDIPKNRWYLYAVRGNREAIIQIINLYCTEMTIVQDRL